MLTVDVDSIKDAHDGQVAVTTNGTLQVASGNGWQMGGTLLLTGGTVVTSDLEMLASSRLNFLDGLLDVEMLDLSAGPTVDWNGGTLQADAVVGDVQIQEGKPSRSASAASASRG